MELFSALGLDWRIFVAQLINFSILLFVLYRFAYKPVFKVLEDRQKKIEKGVDDAERAIKLLEEIENKEMAVIRKAKKDAADFMSEMKKQAEVKRKEIIDKTKKDVAGIIEKEKEKISYERESLVAEVRKEISDLVILASQKLVEGKIDLKANDKIIQEMIKK